MSWDLEIISQTLVDKACIILLLLDIDVLLKKQEMARTRSQQDREDKEKV